MERVLTKLDGMTESFNARLKALEELATAGLKVAVLRASVGSDAREDWIADRVERGIDVLITNPELVKTGLNLLAFPTILPKPATTSIPWRKPRDAAGESGSKRRSKSILPATTRAPRQSVSS